LRYLYTKPPDQDGRPTANRRDGRSIAALDLSIAAFLSHAF
jgi:hypothetical protein